MHNDDKLAPGTVVAARFRVESCLGEGGFGAVYRAVRLSDGLVVALKVLRSHTLELVGGRDRFQREADLARRLWHPNVIRVLEEGVDAHGTCFIAFEFLEGRSLAQEITQRGAFSVRRVAAIALDILGALIAAHAAGVIHRDLKPGNVFLCAGTDQIKVLDFGIAKSINPGTLAGLTQAGAMLGTPAYMPLEQWSGGDVGPATDLFALGVVMTEMLIGRGLYAQSSAMDIVRERLSMGVVPVPAEVLEGPLGGIIRKATAVHAKDRYSNASAMQVELVRQVQGLAPETPATRPGAMLPGGHYPATTPGAGPLPPAPTPLPLPQPTTPAALGGPPMGAPPMGAPPMGAPPMGAPAMGYTPPGYPSPGNPPAKTSSGRGVMVLWLFAGGLVLTALAIFAAWGIQASQSSQEVSRADDEADDDDDARKKRKKSKKRDEDDGAGRGPTDKNITGPEVDVYADPFFSVPIDDDDPQRGADPALVTIVQFSDFQCVYCSKVAPTLDQVLEEYEGQVRLVWKDRPLPIHVYAERAAWLGRAAFKGRKHDRFWSVHDALLAQPLTDEVIDRVADEHDITGFQEFGIDKLNDTARLGDRLGVSGIPAFFINGRELLGSQPFAAFAALIDVELNKAKQRARDGADLDEIYDDIVSEGSKVR